MEPSIYNRIVKMFWPSAWCYLNGRGTATAYSRPAFGTILEGS